MVLKFKGQGKQTFGVVRAVKCRAKESLFSLRDHSEELRRSASSLSMGSYSVVRELHAKHRGQLGPPRFETAPWPSWQEMAHSSRLGLPLPPDRHGGVEPCLQMLQETTIPAHILNSIVTKMPN